LKRSITLTFQYYRIVLLYNIAFTIVWIALALFGFGELNAVVLFWAKVCGFVSAIAIYYYSANQTYFYFRNAGFRMRRILLQAFLMDVLNFIVLYIFITLVAYAAAHLKG
jgi:hypothetical protein